jgi:hypothetical protein
LSPIYEHACERPFAGSSLPQLSVVPDRLTRDDTLPVVLVE